MAGNNHVRHGSNEATATDAIDFAYYHVGARQDTRNPNLKLISSPGDVFDVIRCFDQRKKDLIRSIGFSGILHLSGFTEIDPKFTLWLMKRLRWSTRAFHIGDKMDFVIMPDHIGKVIGIPYSGIEVRDKAFEDDDEKSAFMKLSLSFLGPESHILESAKAYIARELPFGYSKEEGHRFKVAFVIFVMGRFLAPSLDTSLARSDFWGALKNPDAIHSFNWSSFILSDMMDAARVVLWDILRNRNVSVILGCPLILQILYLDNIEIGPLKLTHDVIPRVRHFNSSLLSKMIQADYVAEQSSSSGPEFGRTKNFRRDSLCYNLASSGCTMTSTLPSFDIHPRTAAQSPPTITNLDQMIPSEVVKHHLFENSAAKSTTPLAVSHSPLDSDVPDFAAVLRQYFQGQVESSLLECFRFHQAMCLRHFTKFASGLKAAITKENINLVSKVVNHQRRCNGLPPINLELTRPSVTRRTYDDMLSGAESGNEGDDITPASNSSKNARRFHGEFKTSKTKHVSAASPFPRNCTSSVVVIDNEANIDADKFSTPVNNSRTIQKTPPFGGNVGMRITAGAQCTDDLQRSLQAEYPDSPIIKKIVHPGRLAVTHWSRGTDHPTRDVALTNTFYDWLSTTASSDLNKAWIIHDFPRTIQITGRQLKYHFTDFQPMAHDAFDLCVRRIRQLDKSICPKDVHLRWRHLLESDFSMQVLSGDNPWSNLSIRYQFVSKYLDYELERCRMFFVPVVVDGRWWCYAWDLKTLTLTINDPSVGEEADALVVQKHAGTIQFLNKSLSETIFQFYSSWLPRFNECNFVVFRTPDMPIERSQSAFFTLFFIKNYNGTNLVTATSPNALQKFKEYMLYEILEFKHNRGKPPSDYIHSVDD